jgi:SAM-dependent methyltransferase
MMNNLAYYQQKNKEWVLKEANSYVQAEKMLKVAVGEGRYLDTQVSRGMTASATSTELTPWIERFCKEQTEFLKEPILDIGSGDGGFLNFLREGKMLGVGIDISPDASAKTLKNGLISIQCDAQYGIPFPDKSFKTITMFHSLEHMLFPRKVIKHIDRVLDGNLCIIVPKEAGWHEQWGHYSYYPDQKTLEDTLSGFKTILYEDWGNMSLIIANNAR